MAHILVTFNSVYFFFCDNNSVVVNTLHLIIFFWQIQFKIIKYNNILKKKNCGAFHNYRVWISVWNFKTLNNPSHRHNYFSVEEESIILSITMGVKNLWDILESCKKTVPLHNLQLTHSFTIFIFNQNLFFLVESCTLLDELTWVCVGFWVAGTKGFVWIYRVGWFSFRMWVNLMLVWKRKFILEDSFIVLELSLLLIALLFLFQVCLFAFLFFAFGFYM
jgi:hypothetical protein